MVTLQTWQHPLFLRLAKGTSYNLHLGKNRNLCHVVQIGDKNFVVLRLVDVIISIGQCQSTLIHLLLMQWVSFIYTVQNGPSSVCNTWIMWRDEFLSSSATAHVKKPPIFMTLWAVWRASWNTQRFSASEFRGSIADHPPIWVSNSRMGLLPSASIVSLISRQDW